MASIEHCPITTRDPDGARRGGCKCGWAAEQGHRGPSAVMVALAEACTHLGQKARLAMAQAEHQAIRAAELAAEREALDALDGLVDVVDDARQGVPA